MFNFVYCWRALASLAILPALAVGQPIEIWNNPRAEAEFLAVKTTGELRPDAALTSQIESDLARIRSDFPVVADYRPFKLWWPGQIWLTLTPTAFLDYKNGDFTRFDPLFAELGTPEISYFGFYDSLRYMTLAFGQVYHSERLAELFRAVDGVEQAEAEWSVGDGGSILIDPDRTYKIIHGYGDCPAGCLYSKSWKFAVSEDSVMMLSQPSIGIGEFGAPFLTPIIPSAPEPSTIIYMGILSTVVAVRVRRPRRTNT